MQADTAGTSLGGPANILANAQNVQITGGALTIVQGSVHNYAEGSSQPGLEATIWKALQAVPNFRKIYQDMLSKATKGTGIWLLKNEKFRVWLDPKGHIKIFWGSGMPGAGKTVLASLVIQYLEALHQESPSQICICYYYCRYSDSVDLTVKSILESLLKQILERHPNFLSLVAKTYSQHLREGTQPSEGQLLGLLRQCADGMAVTFYVLDALDEAPLPIQLNIARTLASLNVRLFVTSRPLEFVKVAFPEAHTFCISAQDIDIELHIGKGINDSRGLVNLIAQEGSELREKIMSTIKLKSGGMFLHAALQMDALRPCVSLHQVNNTLNTFPSKIEDAYFQTWDRILDESAESVLLVKEAFVWVLNASRSMTLEELERAVATCPRTSKFAADRVVPGATLMEMCRGLLVVEGESRLVRFVHYTAKEHLERLLNTSGIYPHAHLATICIIHMTECGFQDTAIKDEEEFKATLEGDPLLSYASEAWAFHVRLSINVDEIKQRTAMFVRGSRAFPAFTSQNHTSEFDILSPTHIIANYGLPLEVVDFMGLDVKCTAPLSRQSPLVIACRHNHEKLVGVLLESPDTDVNLANSKFGRSPLLEAVYHGSKGIVALLLARTEIQVNQANNEGLSALMIAALEGHADVAGLLLARTDIHVNQASNNGSSALMIAAFKGHADVAGLLTARTEIQVNQADNDGYSALMLAARKGHADVAALLLARTDIQVNQADNDGSSALMIAASEGHADVAALLLACTEIHVNQADNEGWSALMIAAFKGHADVAGLLLARPEIQVNQAYNDGSSALMIAASEGHADVTALLLACTEIHVNQADNDGYSALMLASRAGHVCIVKALLDSGKVNVNHASVHGSTALLLASEYGHKSVVQLLLDVPNIDCSMNDNDGDTAMSVALSRGHVGILDLLQEFEQRCVIASSQGPTAREASPERDTLIETLILECNAPASPRETGQGAKYFSKFNRVFVIQFILICTAVLYFYVRL